MFIFFYIFKKQVSGCIKFPTLSASYISRYLSCASLRQSHADGGGANPFKNLCVPLAQTTVNHESSDAVPTL